MNTYFPAMQMISLFFAFACLAHIAHSKCKTGKCMEHVTGKFCSGGKCSVVDRTTVDVYSVDRKRMSEGNIVCTEEFELESAMPVQSEEFDDAALFVHLVESITNKISYPRVLCRRPTGTSECACIPLTRNHPRAIHNTYSILRVRTVLSWVRDVVTGKKRGNAPLKIVKVTSAAGEEETDTVLDFSEYSGSNGQLSLIPTNPEGQTHSGIRNKYSVFYAAYAGQFGWEMLDNSVKGSAWNEDENILQYSNKVAHRHIQELRTRNRKQIRARVDHQRSVQRCWDSLHRTDAKPVYEDQYQEWPPIMEQVSRYKSRFIDPDALPMAIVEAHAAACDQIMQGLGARILRMYAWSKAHPPITVVGKEVRGEWKREYRDSDLDQYSPCICQDKWGAYLLDHHRIMAAAEAKLLVEIGQINLPDCTRGYH